MRVQMTNVVLPQNGVTTVKEGTRIRIYFDYEEANITYDSPEDAETAPDNIYYCENIDVEGDQSYGAIVAAIHNGRYSNDDIQAIIGNYELAKDETSDIASDKREEYKADYDAWQAWRSHAKDIARKVLAETN